MTTKAKTMTTQQVASRFSELAQKEKWFEIQDELFAASVKSIEPPDSPYLKNAEGKAEVRKKGQDFVSRIETFHEGSVTEPLVAANHFTVRRLQDSTVHGLGRVRLDQLMLYEVKDGLIISEQFFY